VQNIAQTQDIERFGALLYGRVRAVAELMEVAFIPFCLFTNKGEEELSIDIVQDLEDTTFLLSTLLEKEEVVAPREIYETAVLLHGTRYL
jgi:hypothetical protein